MKCPKCGTESDWGNFCEKCGSPLPQESRQDFVPAPGVPCNPIFISRGDGGVPEEPGVEVRDGTGLFWITYFLGYWGIHHLVLAFQKGAEEKRSRFVLNAEGLITGLLVIIDIALIVLCFVKPDLFGLGMTIGLALGICVVLNVLVIAHMIRQAYGKVYNYTHTIRYRAEEWKKCVAIVHAILGGVALLSISVFSVLLGPKLFDIKELNDAQSDAADVAPLIYEWGEQQYAYIEEKGRFGSFDEIGFVYGNELGWRVISLQSDRRPDYAGILFESKDSLGECPAGVSLIMGITLGDSGTASNSCMIEMTDRKTDELVDISYRDRQKCELVFSDFLNLCVDRNAIYINLSGEHLPNPQAEAEPAPSANELPEWGAEEKPGPSGGPEFLY